MGLQRTPEWLNVPNKTSCVRASKDSSLIFITEPDPRCAAHAYITSTQADLRPQQLMITSSYLLLGEQGFINAHISQPDVF